MKPMRKNEGVDIEGCRELVAGAVGLDVGELTAAKRDDPNVAILRKIAACILAQDKMPLGDVAGILDESESWVRNSIDDIQRRISKYYALSLRVEQMAASYALASIRAGKPAKGVTASGAPIESCRQRIAVAVGMSVIELVAFERDNDAETMQRVATYLLLLKEELSVSDAAKVMCKSEQWIRSAEEYVSRHVKREQRLKDFVAQTTEAYAIAK
jgi:hypothetical protein